MLQKTRHRALLLILGWLVLSGCASGLPPQVIDATRQYNYSSAQQTAAIPRELLGRWTLIGDPGAECASGSLEFTADGHLKVRSGAQILEAIVRVAPQGEGFLIAVDVLRHNDARNCMGRSAAWFAQHFAPFMFVRVTGAKSFTAAFLDKDRRQHGPKTEFSG